MSLIGSYSLLNFQHLAGGIGVRGRFRVRFSLRFRVRVNVWYDMMV